MLASGGRHPYLATYKAAARVDPETGEPKLAALDVQVCYCARCARPLRVAAH